jgi:hypothetical protein
MSLVINDTAYAGTFASYFWLPATFGMDTIEKGVVHVEDGIKKQHTIGRIDFATPLQPRQADPTVNSAYTIDGRVIVPQDVMVYSKFNPRDFESHWLAEELSPTLLARELPVTAENYMIQMALNRAFEQLETGIWMGSKTYTATAGTTGNGQLVYFDGFIKKMVNDVKVLKVASPLPLSAEASNGSIYNIADAFNALLSQCATSKKALLSRSSRYKNMKFLISVSTEQVYHTFLTTSQTFKGVNTTERGINTFKGYTVEVCAGMPDNTIVFTSATDGIDSNLYVGMNSSDDDSTIEMAKYRPDSENYFIKGLMKFDTQYGFGEEAFLYTTLTAGSFNV